MPRKPNDVDNPEWTKADFKKAKPFKDVFPEAHTSWKAARGRTGDVPPRINKTLRLDPRLVNAMIASGQYSARAERALWNEFMT